MHEASIVQYAVQAVRSAAEQNNIKQVRSIQLRIGLLRSVYPEALQQVFTVLRNNDPVFQDCSLLVETVPCIIICKVCQAETVFYENRPLICSKCGAESFTIKQGAELQIVSFKGK